MSVQGNNLDLLGTGTRRIFSYDHAQQNLTTFATNFSAGTGTNLLRTPDRTIYVTNPDQQQVLHFAWSGTVLPQLISLGNLVCPILVTADASNMQVLVTDGLHDQIIVFNKLGTPINIIKLQHVRAIATMVAGPDGIYLVDRPAKQVVALGCDGRFRYAFGPDALSDPGSISVNRDNLVFISDNFKQVIKVNRILRTGNKTIGLADIFGGA